MAKINAETHKKELPGRSIYLSNAQWAALCNLLDEIEDNHPEMVSLLELKEEFSPCRKLHKCAREVVSNDDD